MDLIETKEGAMPKDLRPVPLSDFLEDHRKRWVLRTSAGDLVLKRISYLDLERAVLEAERAFPGYERSSMRAAQLWSVVKAGGRLPDGDMRELNELSLEMSAPAKLFSLPCFVSPAVRTLEEYDALLSRLDREEKAALQLLLSELSSPSFGDRPLSPMLALAQRFGITLPEDLRLESMTAGQAAALTKLADRAAGEQGR
jgi:hypothetical protein